jgi:putative DNA primase/helicase
MIDEIAPGHPLYYGSYFDLLNSSPEQLQLLFAKHGIKLFFRVDERTAKDGEDPEEKLSFESERVAVFLAKTRYAKTLRYDDSLYIHIDNPSNPDCGTYQRGETYVNDFLAYQLPEQACPSIHFQVIYVMKGLTHTTLKDLTPPLNLIPVANGIVEIPVENGVWQKHKKRLISYSHKYFFTSKPPTPYIEGATAPNFTKVLGALAPGDIVFVLQFEGSCYLRRRFQRVCLILFGESGTGKTTIMEAIRYTLGPKNTTKINIQQFSDPIQVVTMFGKMANISGELPPLEIKNGSAFKEVIGGDELRGRALYKMPEDEIPFLKHTFMSNELPSMREDSEAVWSRIQLKRMGGKKYVKRGHIIDQDTEAVEDLEMPEKLQAEAPGIQNILIDAMCDSINNKGYENMDDWRETRRKWLALSEPVGEFMESDMIIWGAAETVSKENTYTTYVKFCEEQGIPAKSKEAFGKELKKLYCYGDHPRAGEERETVNGKQVYSWSGFKVNQKRLEEEAAEKIADILRDE